MSRVKLKDPTNHGEVTHLINEYAYSDELDLHITVHADERMEERGVNEDFLMKTLREGTVIEHEIETYPNGNSSIKYRVSHRDNLGEETVAITVIPGEYQLTIVTIW
ncbi:DUF4258 domain-containing protein [Marinobacter algicola]|uniref:DUF4258 domain-containing protein n=1 Tax=Marinobacter algicola TaxID=236100 RepID=UPI003BAB6C2E